MSSAVSIALTGMAIIMFAPRTASIENGVLAQLPPAVDEDLLGTLGAALISLSDRWAESRDACTTEYIPLGDCRYRHLFLPVGGEGILALFLDVKGDWNSVVAASCMLAERMGQVLELA